MSLFGRSSKRSRPKKDPFDLVTDSFRARVEGKSPEEIDAVIAEVSKLREETEYAMKTDPEVVQLKESLKYATEDYRETIKRCKQELALPKRAEGGWKALR